MSALFFGPLVRPGDGEIDATDENRKTGAESHSEILSLSRDPMTVKAEFWKTQEEISPGSRYRGTLKLNGRST